jgi:PAS domain S-box-containing protein
MSDVERTPLPSGARGTSPDESYEPLFHVTPHARVAYVNAAARARLGLTEGEALASRLDPSSREDLYDLLDARSRDGAFPEGDRTWAWVSRDGTPTAIRVCVTNVRAGGRVTGFAAVVRPDGETAADRRWRVLVDAAPEHILLLDRDYRILYLNREAGGGDPARAVGRGTLDFLPPESRDLVRSYFDRAAAGEVVTFETPAFDLNGRSAWYHVRIAPVPAECRPAVVILFARDVTDRRRDEEFARAVIRHAPVGIRVFDGAGREVRRNREIRRMLGRSADRKVGRYNLLSDPAARESGDADRFRRALAGEVVRDRMSTGVPPDAGDSAVLTPRLVDRVFCPVPDGLGGIQGVAVFCSEVPAQKQLEDKLLESQRLESLGVLAGGLAHDLNNLMTPVVGHAELALGKIPAESRGPVAEHLRQVTRAAEQAAELCRQLLAYAGRGRVAIEPVDLSELIGHGESLLRHAAGPHVDLRLDLSPGLPAVLADRGQVRQVVLNLVANAAEAIGDRPGRVEVSTRLRRMGRPELAGCQVGADRPEGEYVRLAVRDDGPGMPPEVAARVFDPFFTTKFTGRGLGLAAVQGVIQCHGGALSVETAPGRGTTFRLYFPAVAEPAPAAAATDTHTPLPSWGGEVLLADDEVEVQVVTGAMLEGLGFRVDAVSDGREAVERVRSGRRYRLAVLDLTMRDVGGAQALAEIKGLAPELPVVLMSGYSRDEVEGIGGATGPAGFLQKPFRLSDLAERVRAALVGR